MPNSPHETLLCRYHYDPLDRQSGCTLPQQPVIQRFHCDGRLTTEIQGGTRWSILQHDDHLLAQRNHREASVTATLLATDQQRSVLNTLDATGPHPLAYSPYGHHPAIDRLLSVRGFNGEQPDPLTGHYHLGNGYRQFNPVLMRFTSPDSWSPFGEGGLNAYGYCLGNPVTGNDRSGHTPIFLKSFLRWAGIYKKSAAKSAIKQFDKIVGSEATVGNLFKAPRDVDLNITQGVLIDIKANTKLTEGLYTYKNKIATYTVQSTISTQPRAGVLKNITPLENISQTNKDFISEIQSALKNNGYISTDSDIYRFHPAIREQRHTKFMTETDARNIRHAEESAWKNSEAYIQGRRDHWKYKGGM